MLVRTLALTSLLGLTGLIGCGSEGANRDPASPATSPAPETKTPPLSTLDACTLPRPCSWPVDTGSPEQADSIRCVVAELVAGRALSVDTVLVADGPPTGCEVHQELYFFAEKNSAYSIWRKQCGATVERKVQRCTMLTRDAYTTCLAAFDATRSSSEGITCSLPTEWMSSCTEVAEPTCP